MMTRRRGPAKRLLILPALLLIGLIVGLHLVRDATARDLDPTLRIDALPRVAGDVMRCTRSDDETVLHEIRSQLDPGGRVTSGMVLACPTAYDGLEVRYVGELVGDLLERDAGTWVMVNDDDYALEVGPLATHRHQRGTNTGLTVWLPHALRGHVTGLGGPGQRGDVVELRGQIMRTDPADGGGLTLRADSLTLLAAATPVEDPLDLPQGLLALGAAGGGAGLWLLRHRTLRPPRGRS